MEIEKLMQALQQLIGVQTPQDIQNVLQRHPELLKQSSIEVLLGVVEAARNDGQTEMANVIEPVARFLASLSRDLVPRVEPDKAPIAIERVYPEAFVPWARVTRQSLALRRKEILEQAIVEAQNAGELDIADLLSVFREEDFQKISELAPGLYKTLLSAGRFEEGLTIALVELDMKVQQAAMYMHFPVEQQIAMHDAGIQASCRAASYARELGDEACQAFYKAVEGVGYTRGRRLEQAEDAFQAALEIYWRLAVTQAEVFEPELAATLVSQGGVLGDLRRLDQAEQLHQQALKIYRRLAVAHPEEFEHNVAATLNDLGIVLSDLRRLEESEQAYNEAIEIYRRLAVTQTEVFEHNMAATLNNLGIVLRDLLRLEESKLACQEALEINRRLAATEAEIFDANVAATQISRGNVLRDLRQLEQAEQAYQEALEIYRRLAIAHPEVFEPKVAATLNNLGIVLRDLRRLEQSEQAYQEALEIRWRLAATQAEIFDHDVAETLNNLVTVLCDLRRLEDAEQASQEALKIYRRLAATQTEVFEPKVADTLNNLGNVFINLRRLEKAEKAYKEALTIYRSLAGTQTEVFVPKVAGTLNNLGATLRTLRRLEEAEEAYENALEIHQSLAASHSEVFEPDVAGTLNNLGTVLSDLRRLEKAEKAYKEALKIYRSLADSRPEVFEPDVARTLSNLGIVLRVRRLEEAEQVSQEALAIYRRLADSRPEVFEPDVARTLNNLGTVLGDLQRLEQAEQAYQEALKIYRRLAASRPEVFEPDVVGTLNNLGNVLGDVGRLQAEQAYREGLALCRRHYLPVERIAVLSGLGQMHIDKMEWENARGIFDEAVEQIERLRIETLSLDRRMQLFRENASIYENLLICLMKLGRYREALEVAERGKSRTLVDLLKLRDLRPKNSPPELVLEYERMLFQARALQDQPQSGGRLDLTSEDERMRQQEEIKATRDRRLKASQRLDELVAEIRKHDPDFLPHASPLSLGEIQSLAQDSEATITLFRVTGEGSYIFLVYPDGETDVVHEPEFTTNALSEMLVKYEGEKAIDGWVFRYYYYQAALLRYYETRTSEDKDAANMALQAWLDLMESTLGKLYCRLLCKVHQRLKDRDKKAGRKTERLVMIPNRGLAILPLHACWWKDGEGRRYLLDEYVINYAPSLSVFKLCLKKEREGRPNQALLGIANPKPPGDLLFSDWECKEIKRMMGDERCQFLWGENATKEKMMPLIEGRNWVHFSCHAQYRLAEPFSSSIQLAKGDELTLGEILENLDLKQNWLTVLSACETGLVDFREIADEHYGLPMGFIYAGAPTVWGTLWMVNDLTTAMLTREAYSNLIFKGQGKTEALRNAQRWLRDRSAGDLLELFKTKQADLGYVRKDGTDVSELQRIFKHGYSKDDRPYSHPYYWAGMQCVGV